MNKALQTLRKKMEKFNEWETEYLKNTSIDKRFEQFVMLYDFGKNIEKNFQEKQHEEHLGSIKKLQLRYCKKI
jgi:hypothetical protein